MVIEELRRHKSSPEEYFATRPFWAARLLSWEDRIRIEIRGHFWTNDRDIRFSEWWIVKLLSPSSAGRDTSDRSSILWGGRLYVQTNGTHPGS